MCDLQIPIWNKLHHELTYISKRCDNSHLLYVYVVTRFYYVMQFAVVCAVILAEVDALKAALKKYDHQILEGETRFWEAHKDSINEWENRNDSGNKDSGNQPDYNVSSEIEDNCLLL